MAARFYEAKWRDSERRQVKQRLGPAWLQRDADGGWRPRPGTPAEGFLEERDARRAMAAAIAGHEQELVLLCGGTSALFDTAAVDWLRHVERVDGLKPSTLQGYRYRLTPPDTPARSRDADALMDASCAGSVAVSCTRSRPRRSTAGWTSSTIVA